MNYILSLAAIARVEMSRFYLLGSEMLKISELNISVEFLKADLSLKCNEMKLIRCVIIGAIARNDRVLIPKDNDSIHNGDKHFIFSESQIEIYSPMDIFA